MAGIRCSIKNCKTSFINRNPKALLTFVVDCHPSVSLATDGLGYDRLQLKKKVRATVSSSRVFVSKM